MTVSQSAYFIADAHLGMALPGLPEREDSLSAFLQEAGQDATHLFIVGDFFDFWIEYRNAVRPEYFPILCRLKQLAGRGVEIHYLAGNHDFALGDFFENMVGVRTHSEHLAIELQGKRLYINHGDGLVKSDFLFLIIRSILRNKTNQRLYKILHPDVAVPLATFFSKTSRKYNDPEKQNRIVERYKAVARNILKQEYDIAILAHTHKPQIYDFGGKVFCNPGEWLRRFTFAKLESGNMTLWEWEHGGRSRQLPYSSE